MEHVLHLHGVHDQPERIVLTQADYEAHYGDIVTTVDGIPTQTSLDRIPRKVVWSLLLTYPTLFVGLSLDDPALHYILGIIRADFRRGRHLDHFAIMGAESDEEEGILRDRWIREGITPIFYRVVKSPEFGTDHSNIKTLVADLGTQLAVDVGLDSLGRFSRRMLDL